VCYVPGMDSTDTTGADLRRVPTNVRLLPSGRLKLDTSAHKHSRPEKRLTRSDVLKACMVIAYRHEAELDRLLGQQAGGEL
jgi:hypothetical protein